MIAIAVIATATVAGGTMMIRRKQQADAQRKVAAARAMRYRNAYRSVRTPSYAHITSDDVAYHGNFRTRDIQQRNARYRWNNRMAMRSSIWDLERFLR